LILLPSSTDKTPIADLGGHQETLIVCIYRCLLLTTTPVGQP
jgi:hypothetical protein